MNMQYGRKTKDERQKTKHPARNTRGFGLCGALVAAVLGAGSAWGDVVPAGPGTWTNSTAGYVWNNTRGGVAGGLFMQHNYGNP
jgi:hypothetical protein